MQEVVASPTGVSVPNSSGPISADLYSKKLDGATTSFRNLLLGLDRQRPDLEAAAHWGKITETDVKALERKDMKAISPELKHDLDDRARELGTRKLDTSRLLPEFKRLLSELDAEFTCYREGIESRFDDLCDAFSTPHLGSVAAETAAAEGLGRIEALLGEAKHFSDLPGLVQSLTSELRKFEEILEQCRSEREELAKITARAQSILSEGAVTMVAAGNAAVLTELHEEVLPSRESTKLLHSGVIKSAPEKKLSPEDAHAAALDDAGFKGEVAMKVLRVLVSGRFFGNHCISEEGMRQKMQKFASSDVREQLKLLSSTGLISDTSRGGGFSVRLDSLPHLSVPAVSEAFKYWCAQHEYKLRNVEATTPRK